MADLPHVTPPTERPTLRIGSLFAGIGGFDLAARWMGWETAWFSEMDPYASAVLAKHWPGVPNYGDITKIDFTKVEPVDLLCGGFPCQDISNAGKRVGITGERSGLWVEYARAIRELRPRWVVIENVAALLGRGYDVVRGDLRDAGYLVARPVVMSASAVGAPHFRERLWVVAHTRGGKQQHGQCTGDKRPKAGDPGRHVYPWEIEPDVGRVADGVPHRVDRLRCLGNAIVPDCALVIFRAIQAQREAAMRRVA
jgi:DNA (cytosine-5)-methyltransferase 1